MAVREENYSADDVSVLKRKACVTGVRRARNGSWHVTVDVEVELRLPDGRLVTAWEEVSLKGTGERMARPTPTWLHRQASDSTHGSA